MSLTTITISKFDGTNDAQWVTEKQLLHKHKQVYCIIKQYDNKPEEPAGKVTATVKAAFKYRINLHCVARLHNPDGYGA